MAGTFSHIAVVRVLYDKHLDEIPGLTDEMKGALRDFGPFLELGSVSPDYPFFTSLNNEAKGWGNVMHYGPTGRYIKLSIPRLVRLESDEKRHRCLAWLFGFAAHVITDLTVHPVVKAKVGDYDSHPKQHRFCELQQDAFIFHEMGYGEITTSNVQIGRLMSCSDPANNMRLHPDIKDFWLQMLRTFPLHDIELLNRVSKPTMTPQTLDFGKWHNNCCDLLGLADKTGHLYPLARFIAEDKAAVYPLPDEINYDYVTDLQRPDDNQPIDFKAVFERTLEQVKGVWQQLSTAITADDAALFTLADSNLDTGLAAGKLVAWDNAVPFAAGPVATA
jgi:hypothetical protein